MELPYTDARDKYCPEPARVESQAFRSIRWLFCQAHKPTLARLKTADVCVPHARSSEAAAGPWGPIPDVHLAHVMHLAANTRRVMLQTKNAKCF
jgi:hypothetical protein